MQGVVGTCDEDEWAWDSGPPSSRGRRFRLLATVAVVVTIALGGAGFATSYLLGIRRPTTTRQTPWTISRVTLANWWV